MFIGKIYISSNFSFYFINVEYHIDIYIYNWINILNLLSKVSISVTLNIDPISTVYVIEIKKAHMHNSIYQKYCILLTLHANAFVKASKVTYAHITKSTKVHFRKNDNTIFITLRYSRVFFFIVSPNERSFVAFPLRISLLRNRDCFSFSFRPDM